METLPNDIIYNICRYLPYPESKAFVNISPSINRMILNSHIIKFDEEYKKITTNFGCNTNPGYFFNYTQCGKSGRCHKRLVKCETSGVIHEKLQICCFDCLEMICPTEKETVFTNEGHEERNIIEIPVCPRCNMKNANGI